MAQTVPAENPLIPAANWRVMGQSASKVVGVDFVTGKTPLSVRPEVAGHVVRQDTASPSFGATLLRAGPKKQNRWAPW